MLEKLRKTQFFSSPAQDSWGKKVMAWYENQCTPLGKPLLLMAFVSISLGMVGQELPLAILSPLLLAFLGAIWIEGWLHRPQAVEVKRTPPIPITAGHEAHWKTQLTNKGKRILYHLEIQETLEAPSIKQDLTATAQLSNLASQEICERTFTLKCPQRGIYYFKQTTVFSSFPFFLFKWKKTNAQSDSLIVYPTYRYLSELDLKFGRKYQSGGILLSSNVGESVEFMGVREYVQGDNPKYIHWPSLAKTGRLGVREFHEEYFSRLGLIIDGEVADSQRMADGFEAAISITASIADWITRKDFIIDIFATGNQVHHFQAGRSLAHLDNILKILASLEPTNKVSMRTLAQAIAPQLPGLSALVCVFLQWDHDREWFVQHLLELGIGIKILLIRDTAQSSPPAEWLPMVTEMRAEDWGRIHL